MAAAAQDAGLAPSGFPLLSIHPATAVAAARYTPAGHPH
jgi:hypothetical protein